MPWYYIMLENIFFWGVIVIKIAIPILIFIALILLIKKLAKKD